MSKLIKRLLIIAGILAVLYVLYKIFIEDNQFDEFDDDYELDDVFVDEDSLIGRAKGAVKKVIGR